MAGQAPPPHDETTDDPFGLHWDIESVKLAVIGIDWGFLPFPGGFFDQPESLIYDVLRYKNKQAEIRDDGQVHAPPDMEQDQPITETVKRITL